MMKRLLVVALAVVLFAAACSDDSDTSATDDSTETDDSEAEDESATDPVTGPASISASNQTGDGTTVVVDTLTLPVEGFIVIHGDNGGAPGAVIGHSDLLPAGESTDIEVVLDTPLEQAGMVFPMAHVDANGNGIYEFAPPDEVTDVPALTADGAVAVLGVEYSIGGGVDLTSGALGEYLVDGSGNTLYLFVPDGQGDSQCYEQCEDNWPIVGPIAAVGAGLDESLIGTIERTTGDTQATYNSWPLYYFIGDAAAGDTNGQGVNDVWYVLGADGQAITN